MKLISPYSSCLAVLALGCVVSSADVLANQTEIGNTAQAPAAPSENVVLNATAVTENESKKPEHEYHIQPPVHHVPYERAPEPREEREGRQEYETPRHPPPFKILPVEEERREQYEEGRKEERREEDYEREPKYSEPSPVTRREEQREYREPKYNEQPVIRREEEYPREPPKYAEPVTRRDEYEREYPLREERREEPRYSHPTPPRRSHQPWSPTIEKIIPRPPPPHYPSEKQPYEDGERNERPWWHFWGETVAKGMSEGEMIRAQSQYRPGIVGRNIKLRCPKLGNCRKLKGLNEAIYENVGNGQTICVYSNDNANSCNLELFGSFCFLEGLYFGADRVTCDSFGQCSVDC